MSDIQLIDEKALSEIEARAEAATAGPWTAYHRISPRGAHKQWHIGNGHGLCQITMNGYERDYEFMAHARLDIPAMAATIRGLWAKRYVPKVLVGDEVITYRNYAEDLLKRYIKQGEALQEAFEVVEQLRQRLAEVEAERDELRKKLEAQR